MDTQGRFRNFDSVFPVIILIGLTGFVTDQILASLRIYLFPWTSETLIAARSTWTLCHLVIGSNLTVSPATERHVHEQWIELPDCSADPEVAARFNEIRQRPVKLQVRELSKRFTTAKDRLMCSSRYPSMCTAENSSVIRPSGCGKSTLIRILAGLLNSGRSCSICKTAAAGCRARHGLQRLHTVSLADS